MMPVWFSDLKDFLFNLAWPLETHHFHYFLLSSLATVCIGFALCLVYGTRAGKWINLINIIPVFLSPILISRIVIDFFSVHLSGTVRADPKILTIFGILFHSWLSYYILFYLFGVQEKIKEFRDTCEKGRLLGNPHFALVPLAFLKFARPLILTVGIVLVFHESMISPAAFLDKTNVTLTALIQDHCREALDMYQRPVLAGLLFTFFGFLIAVAYLLSTLVENAARRMIDRGAFRTSGHQTLSWLRHIFVVLTLSCSTALHLFFLAIIALAIFSALRDNSWSVTDGHIAEVLRTFFSDSTIMGSAAALGMLALLFYAIFIARYQARRAWRSLVILAAISPPVLYGILGFVMANGNVSRMIAELLILLTYGAILFLFFFSPDLLLEESVLIRNGIWQRHSLKRIMLIISLSNLFLVINALVLTFYYLWVEDGIQISLSSDNNYLSSKIRSSATSELNSGTIAGLIIAVGVFLIIRLIVSLLDRLRFKWANAYLGRALIVIFMILCHLQSRGDSVAQGTKTAELVPQVTKLVRVRDRELILAGKTVANYTIDTLRLANSDATTLWLQVPQHSGILIKHLIIDGNKSVVTFDAELRTQLSIFQIEHVETAVNEPVKIQLSNLAMEDLHIDNPSSGIPPFDFLMDESCTVNRFEMNEGRLHTLKLVCGNNSTIALGHIILNRLQLTRSKHYRFEESSQVLRAENLLMERNDNDLPEIDLDGLNLAATSIGLMGSRHQNDNFTLKIHNCCLSNNGEENNDRPTQFSLGDLNSEIDISSVSLDGEVQINVDNLSGLTLNNVSNKSSLLSSLNCKIKNAKFDTPRIDLFDVSLPNLIIDAGDIKHISAGFHFVTVKGEFEVSENIVRSMNSQTQRAYERNRFFEMLQSNGKICGEDDHLGLNALYLKKREDISGNALVGFVVDWLTGLGIKLYKPFISFIAYTTIVLFFIAYRLKTINNNTWGKATRNSINWILFNDNPLARNKKDMFRLLIPTYRMIFFVQSTMLSIYLSQITLR